MSFHGFIMYYCKLICGSISMLRCLKDLHLYMYNESESCSLSYNSRKVFMGHTREDKA